MRSSHRGQGFGEDLSNTNWIPTAEAPNLQPQLYSAALPGQILKPPLVFTVPRARDPVASWTADNLPNVSVQQKPIVHALDLVQDQVVRGQNCLRMARGSCHCKMSLKQYRFKLFWASLTRQRCTESAEDPIYSHQHAQRIQPALRQVALQTIESKPRPPLRR